MKWHHWPVEVVAKDRSLWDGRHPVAVQGGNPGRETENSDYRS